MTPRSRPAHRPRAGSGHDRPSLPTWAPASGVALAVCALLVAGGRSAGADTPHPAPPSAATTAAAPTGGMPVAPTSSAAGDQPPAGAGCTDLAARYVSQAPPGWRIDCLPDLPAEWQSGSADAGSMSDRRERRIVIVNRPGRTDLEAAVAHEVAHAEASAWPADLRAAVSHAMGEPRWAGAGGPTAPVEVFAESSVRCRGLPTRPEYPLVPCDLVEAARRAGGATDALPVTGTSPTS